MRLSCHLGARKMKLSVVDRADALSDEYRELLERRLSFALSRFDARIRGTSVVFEDINGPRGGIDKSCRITVNLNRARDVVICGRDSNIAKCIAHSADRAGRAVARAVELSQRKSRRKPLGF